MHSVTCEYWLVACSLLLSYKCMQCSVSFSPAQSYYATCPTFSNSQQTNTSYLLVSFSQGGYDMTLGTSERGESIDDFSDIPKFRYNTVFSNLSACIVYLHQAF